MQMQAKHSRDEDCNGKSFSKRAKVQTKGNHVDASESDAGQNSDSSANDDRPTEDVEYLVLDRLADITSRAESNKVLNEEFGIPSFDQVDAMITCIVLETIQMAQILVNLEVTLPLVMN